MTKLTKSTLFSIDNTAYTKYTLQSVLFTLFISKLSVLHYVQCIEYNNKNVSISKLWHYKTLQWYTLKQSTFLKAFLLYIPVNVH